MHRLPFQTPPTWWSSCMNQTLVRLLGPLTDRLCGLMEEILGRVEQRHALNGAGDLKMPGRINRARQKAIEAKEAATDDAERGPFEDDLDDLFLVAQLYSYPGNYIAEQPSIERIADTIKKFEEDMLGRNRPKPHGDRNAVVAFGEPIAVEKGRKKGLAAELTARMETDVQQLLDSIGNGKST